MAERSLEPFYWKACAGIPSRFPAAGAAVYYFPEGHSEQASSPPDLPAVRRREAFVFPCSVASVRLLADRDTDEVYALIGLVPSPAPAAAPPDPVPEDELGVAGPAVVWHAKVLTPSDANNGGGFSIPRYAAEDSFPLLNYKANPAFQKLWMADAHGKVWGFRHIYRGTPKRHLLTTGWTQFVNGKRLIAGDSIVFIRNAEGAFFVGVRRAAGRKSRKRKRHDFSNFRGEVAMMEGVDDGGFSRTGRGRVAPEAVVEAVVAAEEGRPFEVVYYPRTGGDFVVGRAKVDAAVGIQWRSGMRVRAPVEVEASVKFEWRQGTVMGMKAPEQGHCSPWRTLQVKWDEPAFFPPIVNPWEVELVTETPQIPNPVTFRRTRTENARLNEMNQSMPFTASRINSPISGSVNSSSVVYNSFPAGMQGARQDIIPAGMQGSRQDIIPAGMQGARQDITGVSSLSPFSPYNIQCNNKEEAAEEVVPLKLDHVPTGLSIRSPPSSETPSPLSNNTVLHSAPTTCSFRLFGQTILMELPVNSDANLSDTERGATTVSPAISIPCEENQPSEIQEREEVLF